ncbi:MAG: hypothetical protein LBM93_03760, partial [Oscillospiraceae bacterium]|jgi:hypothetical protein|nr:hypothetical protein [Oscillospiraceae bacterium]
MKLVNKGFEDFLLPLFKIENAPDVYEKRMCLPIRGKWKRKKIRVHEEVEELLKIGREEQKFKIFKDYLLQHNIHIQVDNLGKPWGENKYYIFYLGR